MKANYYCYEELKAKALSADATAEDLINLGEWFERFGSSYWNGEYYEVDSTHKLYPIWHYIGGDDIEIIGYDFID